MKSRLDDFKHKLSSQGIEIDESSLITKYSDDKRNLIIKFKEHGINRELPIVDFVLTYLKGVNGKL